MYGYVYVMAVVSRTMQQPPNHWAAVWWIWWIAPNNWAAAWWIAFTPSPLGKLQGVARLFNNSSVRANRYDEWQTECASYQIRRMPNRECVRGEHKCIDSCLEFL